MIATLLLWACVRRPAPGPAVEATGEIAVETPAPSGVVVDGRFTDGTWSLVVPIPDGWEARPGLKGSGLRLTLDHVETGARVEIWGVQDAALVPRPRAGCTWTFQDRGGYRAVRVPGDVTVATCTPTDPTGPHLFAYLVPRPDVAWHLEITAPGDRLLIGKALGDAVLASIGW